MSSNFTPRERLIAGLISRFPKIKTVLKFIYQIFMYLISKKKTSKIYTSFDRIGRAEVDTFFGYYDKFPMNEAGLILAHQAVLGATKRHPGKTEKIRVVVFEKDNLLVEGLSVETRAFNWQQGARAHWVDNDRFFVNDYTPQENQFYAKLYSYKAGDYKRFSRPVQDSFCDKFFLAVNYKRLALLNADYGYFSGEKFSDAELHDLRSDGIWLIDIKTGAEKMLISLEEITNISHEKRFDRAVHCVNHVMISPSGSRFIFIHRYYIGDVRYDRLMILTFNGAIHLENTVEVLPGADIVSHYCWLTDQKILIYMKINGGDFAYYVYNFNTRARVKVESSMLDGLGDGHPSGQGDQFVIDTYPDKSRMQSLVLFNLAENTVRKLAYLKHSLVYYGDSRCDLHPRFNSQTNLVFIDSVFEGSRGLYMLDLTGSD